MSMSHSKLITLGKERCLLSLEQEITSILTHIMLKDEMNL